MFPFFLLVINIDLLTLYYVKMLGKREILAPFQGAHNPAGDRALGVTILYTIKYLMIIICLVIIILYLLQVRISMEALGTQIFIAVILNLSTYQNNHGIIKSANAFQASRKDRATGNEFTLPLKKPNDGRNIGNNGLHDAGHQEKGE